MLALSLYALLPALGCGARDAAQNPPQAQPAATPAAAAQTTGATAVPKSATCALLSDEEIKAVLGEEPQDAQGSEHVTGGLVASQCFFRMQTFGKSFNLEVVRAAPDGPNDAVKAYWRSRFSREAVEARERVSEEKEKAEREREKESEKEKAGGQFREGGHAEERERGDEETGARPQRVAGLGDEAYWTGGRTADSLSILKGDTVINISVGGAADSAAKLNTAKALTQKVLKHF